MVLLGIAGLKGSGKDEVARMLCVEHGFEVRRLAAPLKSMLAAFYRGCGVDEETILRKIEGDLKQEPCELLRGQTPRYAMQTLGTEWGRNRISEDLWTTVLARSLQSDSKVVVPDVRFLNECAAIVELGGKVCRVDASQRIPQDEFSAHSSEQDIPLLPADYEIDNNGTVFELAHAVRALVERCLG